MSRRKLESSERKKLRMYLSFTDAEWEQVRHAVELLDGLRSDNQIALRPGPWAVDVLLRESAKVVKKHG